jgi:DNA-binding transcriptional LysR family regulator
VNWDSIKLFLALYRQGSARVVAEQFSISPATVTRHMTELEANLGAKLFVRSNVGFELTESGQTLLRSAQKMETSALELERLGKAEDSSMGGRIKLTLGNHLMARPLMAALAEFAATYPTIDFDVIPSWQKLDLSRGEADIALRMYERDAQPPDALVGSKVVDVYTGVYCSKQYANEHDLNDPSDANWIGWADEERFPDWVLASPFPNLPTRHYIDDVYGQRLAAKAHMGLVMLPCFICDDDSELVRIPQDFKIHRFELWMLCHPSLRDSNRFKRLREFLRLAFARQREFWRGKD